MLLDHLDVLLSGHRDLSCTLLIKLSPKFLPAVGYGALVLHLVMHVDDAFLSGLDKDLVRPDLGSLLTFEISLHTNAGYPFIIPKKRV
jgi:hypothetical protein